MYEHLKDLRTRVSAENVALTRDGVVSPSQFDLSKNIIAIVVGWPSISNYGIELMGSQVRTLHLSFRGCKKRVYVSF